MPEHEPLTDAELERICNQFHARSQYGSMAETLAKDLREARRLLRAVLHDFDETAEYGSSVSDEIVAAITAYLAACEGKE